jgi:hypothetical protein
MKIVNKLIEYGVIEEFNDWAQHFLAGTKGQPKTDTVIIDYVKSLLDDVYPDQPEKVKNCKLAPWLVMAVKSLGPENIGTADRNKMIDVANWFKVTGTEGPFKNKDLNGAYEFVVAKNAESERKKESRPELDADGGYQLQAEKDGKVKRIGNVGDGSGRIWVQVIDGSWLAEPSELNPHHKWGVKCQSENQHGFQNSSTLNVQLVGPPKGNPNGKWSTQLAIAGPSGTGDIKEIKQEGNQQPGSMSTSGGYSDGDQMVINFLCGNPFAKQNFKRFILYHGGVPQRRGNNTYGGDAFLEYISDRKPELFNKLMDSREDILENNRELIISLKGQEWFEERELNLNDLARNNPQAFLEKFERLYKRYGQDAADLLKEIDIVSMYNTNPNLVKKSISSFVGRIPAEEFISLFELLDLKDYIASYPNEFKEVLKFMSNDKAYKGVLEKILSSNPEVFFSAFGRGTQGVTNFMSFASSPRIREHQNAKWDPNKEEWRRAKKEYVRDENGNIKTDENGERLTRDVEVVVPENLLFMDQKERRKFIEKNKGFILSMMKGTDLEKNMSYLKILLPQLSDQEAKKMLETNDLKGQIIKYYDDKYDEFKKDREKGDQFLIQKYGRNVQGLSDKLYHSYKPGVLEFYSQFKMGKPGSRKIPLAELKADMNKIKNYYAFKSNESEKSLKQIDGFVEFLKECKENGAPDEEILKIIQQVDKSAILKSPTLAVNFFSRVLPVLKRSKAISEAEKLKPSFSKMGAVGEGYYTQLVEKLSILQYAVNSGDRIMFKGNEGFRQKFKLTDGRKYLVIDVRDTYKKDLPGEENTNIENIEAINAEVLVSEDDAGQGYGGQNIWVPSDRFDVRSQYVLMSERLKESFQAFGSMLKKLRTTINESASGPKPRYTAIMLDDDSMSRLQQLVDDLKEEDAIGDDWKVSADHVTMNMGAVKDKQLLGQQVTVDVTAIAKNDMVVAVKVSVDKNLDFGGRTPHITLAFNKNAGGKPAMSNQLKEWKSITTIKLKGNIEEVY